ncbi:MAG TPA: hypothetical protein VFE63_17315 [Roseiarcus sp.]|nr:hypothetical protein [Roseiarcus sp.]
MATRLLIGEKVLASLQSQDSALYTKLTDPTNQKWYYFGVLGPAIGDFVPSTSAGFGAPPINPYLSIWRQVLRIAVGDTTTPLPGLVPTLQTLTGIVNQMTTLVANRDFNGMIALKNSGQLNAVNQASADLTTILQFFTNTSNLAPITNLIQQSNPKINNTNVLVPEVFWAGRDWLHWKHSGDFAAVLYQSALARGDDRYLAYAVGWQVAYAALVCSSGFMNSIAGTTYRTYWWRSRWIELVADAWVWGYYGAGATIGREGPEPSYDQWTSPSCALCAAKLHAWVDLTGGADPSTIAAAVVAAQPLPAISDIEDFATNIWLPAWKAANNNPAAPIFDAAGLSTAHYMLWLVLWFQTSGDVIGCNPPPGAPPKSCGDNPTPPDWIDPTKTNPVTGQPFQPQQPTPKHDPNVGEVICGAILAALGLASEFFGGGLIGAGAIAGGIALIVDGEEQLNWDELECQLYWLGVYLYNGFEALHKLTVLAGFQHPYPADLAASPGPLSFGIADLNFPAFGDMCRSVSLYSTLTPWGGNLLDPGSGASAPGSLDWTQYPKWSYETPVSNVWLWPNWWPDTFIDNNSNRNPGGSAITTPPSSFNAGVAAPFPPSVPTAVQLITTPQTSLPNWNLDGDRGLGWLAWTLAAPYTTNVTPVPGS